MTIRIVVADDHKIVREGLRALLEKEPDMEIIAEAENGLIAQNLVCELKPDVIIIDIAMPHMNGIEAIRRIRDSAQNTKIVVLSMYSDQQFVLRALKLGARGYMVKDGAAAELVRAIRAVVANQTYLSPAVTDGVLDVCLHDWPESDSGYLSILTSRECEILQLIAEGVNVKDIASTCNISSKTVETHRQRIMTKLRIDNKTDLIKYAIREGLVSLESFQ